MKKLLKNLLFLLLTLLLVAGCFRNDIRTEVFQVTPLDTTACSQQITAAVNRLPGIKKTDIDLRAQTLTVTFNGLELYLKNIESAIVQAGFDLPHWPATAADKATLMKEIQP